MISLMPPTSRTALCRRDQDMCKNEREKFIINADRLSMWLTHGDKGHSLSYSL